METCYRDSWGPSCPGGCSTAQVCSIILSMAPLSHKVWIANKGNNAILQFATEESGRYFLDDYYCKVFFSFKSKEMVMDNLGPVAHRLAYAKWNHEIGEQNGLCGFRAIRTDACSGWWSIIGCLSSHSKTCFSETKIQNLVLVASLYDVISCSICLT